MEEKKKRVYFIGSGPSIAMGIPSVNLLFDVIMKNLDTGNNPLSMHANDCPNFYGSMHIIANASFPNLKRSKINFEELLTLLDESGISPEIYKFRRLGETGDFTFSASMGDIYKHLVLLATMVISERMSEPRFWSENSRMFEELRVKKENNVALTESELEWEKTLEKETEYTSKIKNAWTQQYQKLDPFGGARSMWGSDHDLAKTSIQNFIITTNYDLQLESALNHRYSYLSLQENKTLLLKLHGSMNWFELQPNEYISDEEILIFKDRTRIGARREKFDANGHFSYARESIITPPITLKKYDDPLFRQMFWQASNVLMDADELVILGYGFSPHDFFVKKLFDFAINSEKSRISKIFHFDSNEKLKSFFIGDEKKEVDPFIRKGNVKDRYIFRCTDFSTHVPDFDNIIGPLIPIFQ